MGVPAFYKWLTLRYPNIVIDAREDYSDNEPNIDFSKITSGNNVEIPSIDNFYLDMNGIIHPCSHPVDRESPKSFAEMFNSIFDYVDKLMRIIKPKRLIYLAIDGVAPRAKMNQQRSRRFRSALETIEKKKQEDFIEKEWLRKGLEGFDTNKLNKSTFEFDSNTITPGTEFFAILSEALVLYIKSRLNKDPLWKDIDVILSDANAPGEGEHKILDFIRKQRTYKSYNPNTTHCICGADADLIMLSLIIHEPHFYIIRETLNEKIYLKCEHCGKQGHTIDTCKQLNGYVPITYDEIMAYNKQEIDKIEFSLIKIPVIREYLSIEFNVLLKKHEYNFERIIDDFVLICFLVGNDFLPLLPSLKIREGAIDALIYLYKKIRPELNDYLTNGKGQINLKECEVLFQKLALIEDEFFKQETINKINYENYKRSKNESNVKPKKTMLEKFNDLSDIRSKHKTENNNEIDLLEVASNAVYRENDQDFSVESIRKNGKEKFKQLVKEKIIADANKKVSEYKDNVRLGEVGWKDRYYQEKFKFSPLSNDLPKLKEQIKQYYIEGISWVFEYYYNGCVSWDWFYPFHYAPFASDLTELTSIKVNFTKGKPFQPFEQLLSVLPPYSAASLPKCLQKYMTDPLSEIIDFYPNHIKLDINNQPYAWMGVNLIPFIDENRIRKIIKEKIAENAFTQDEQKRNLFSKDLFFCKGNKNQQQIIGTFTLSNEYNSYGNNVNIPLYDNNKLNLKNINEDKIKCYLFEQGQADKEHMSELLDGVIEDKKIIGIERVPDSLKKRFNGANAIRIVKNIIGYSDEDDIEYDYKNAFFDEIGNNNRAIEDRPMEFRILQKKIYREKMKDMELARERSNQDYYREMSNRNTVGKINQFPQNQKEDEIKYAQKHHHNRNASKERGYYHDQFHNKSHSQDKVNIQQYLQYMSNQYKH